MIDLYFVIVLYNKKIEEIRSLDVFRDFVVEHDNANILIYDNSNKEYLTKNASKSTEYEKVMYFDNKGNNKGLTYNYNLAIDYANHNSHDGYWLFLSDDDTLFSKEYIDNAYKRMKTGEDNIISGLIPRVSPSKRHCCIPQKDNIICKKGLYKNIFCINSGLILHSTVFNYIGGKYDESLFLDMVDYWLMDKLIEKGKCVIRIVPGKIEQRLSAQQSMSRERMMVRYRIFKKDFIRYCELTNKSLWFKWIILLKRYINIQRKGLIYKIKKYRSK